MPSLPSNVAELSLVAEANSTMARELGRIANLPMNLIRLYAFVDDLIVWDENGCLCKQLKHSRCDDTHDDSQADTQMDPLTELNHFRESCPNPQAELAIDELGLTDEDLLDIYRTVCRWRIRESDSNTRPNPVPSGLRMRKRQREPQTDEAERYGQSSGNPGDPSQESPPA